MTTILNLSPNATEADILKAWKRYGVGRNSKLDAAVRGKLRSMKTCRGPIRDKSEAKFQKEIRNYFGKEGAAVLLGSKQVGWPDTYVGSLFWTGWLELKVGSQLSDLQLNIIEKLTANKVPVFCARYVLGQVVLTNDEKEYGRCAWPGSLWVVLNTASELLFPLI